MIILNLYKFTLQGHDYTVVVLSTNTTVVILTHGFVAFVILPLLNHTYLMLFVFSVIKDIKKEKSMMIGKSMKGLTGGKKTINLIIFFYSVSYKPKHHTRVKVCLKIYFLCIARCCAGECR